MQRSVYFSSVAADDFEYRILEVLANTFTGTKDYAFELFYWDLVNAYEQAQVSEQSLAFAQQSLDTAKKQLQLDSIPEMDVMRAEAEVSRRDQDLTVARTTLQLQELLIKNALTRRLDDAVLEAVPVVPTDRLESTQPAASQAVQDLIAQALRDRQSAFGHANTLRSDTDPAGLEIR